MLFFTYFTIDFTKYLHKMLILHKIFKHFNMRKYLLLLLFVVYGSSFSFAQEEDLLDFVWDRIETNDSALQNDLERRLVLGEDTMPSGRFKQPIKFTKGELNKIKDPRVRDVYWYALNDTTDSKRYLKAHYAFNAARDNWAFEFGGGVQSVFTNFSDPFGKASESFSVGPQVDLSFKKDLHPYWAMMLRGQYSMYKRECSLTTNLHLSITGRNERIWMKTCSGISASLTQLLLLR